MTELTLTTAARTTALAEYLTEASWDMPNLTVPRTGPSDSAGSYSPPKLVPYLGTLTPWQLDAQDAETDALLSGVALHDLGWLRRIVVRGEDRFRWLSGMVTNGVETLDDRRGAYNLVLNAQGRIQGDCYVWRDGETLELEVTANQADALLTHLENFIIMDDVELAPVSGQSTLGLTGPQAKSILDNLGFPVPENELSSTSGMVDDIFVRLMRGYGTVVPHYALWATEEQIPKLWQALLAVGATPVGSASLEVLRVTEGIPGYGVDIHSRDLAQETAQERALNFTKGCYLGQEIVERIRSRGQVHRHLRALELTADAGADLPPVGGELRVSGHAADAKPAGTLTSVSALQLNGARRIFAIAMIRAEAEVGRQPLTYPGGTAQILHTPPNLI